MATCENCGSSDLVPSHGPWWMDRVNAWLFRCSRCRSCGEFVHAGTGERIAPLFWWTTLRFVLGGLLIVVFTSIGPAFGGRPEWWFAGSFVAWWVVLGLTLIHIRIRE